MARLLIVEDDAIIAFDLAQQLAQFGFEISGVATNCQRALKLLAESICDAAIVDFNLGRETSEPVAHELIARNVPFVLVSGYGHDQHREAFRTAPFLAKPIAIAELILVLNRLLSPQAS